MEKPRPEEETIIKHITNLFRLKIELNDTGIKDTRNLFKLEKETKAIKARIRRDIKNLFEHEPVRVSNFWSKIILNMKVTVIDIKHLLKSILIK